MMVHELMSADFVIVCVLLVDGLCVGSPGLLRFPRPFQSPPSWTPG